MSIPQTENPNSSDTKPYPLIGHLTEFLPNNILSSPSQNTRPDPPKIAIVGAGLTGLTSASHCLNHGFSDVTIFESSSSPGGIWTTAPSSSTSLRLNSLIYRPSPCLSPESIQSLLSQYNLPCEKFRFNTTVEDIYRDHPTQKWIINSPRNGRFDAVIICVGTVTSEPRLVRMPGLDRFLKSGRETWHSSRLGGSDATARKSAATGMTTTTTKTLRTRTKPKIVTAPKKCEVRDRQVVIVDVGDEGGAGGVIEALEYAAKEGAITATVLTTEIGKRRNGPKRLLPRGRAGDAVVLALGKELTGRLIPEMVLRRLFYRSLEDLIATLDAETVERIRSIKTDWIRCEINHFTDGGINISRQRGKVPEIIEADVVVMATGYKQPQLSALLPGSCFPPRYRPPNWFLGTFPTNSHSIAYINCGSGRFSNWRIRLHTRVLLMFLLDPATVPSTFWMKRSIDVTRVLKSTSPIGALEIFCYVELLCWFVVCVAFHPLRWKWVFFLLFGMHFMLPQFLSGHHDQVEGGRGIKREDFWSKSSQQGVIVQAREIEMTE